MDYKRFTKKELTDILYVDSVGKPFAIDTNLYQYTETGG